MQVFVCLLFQTELCGIKWRKLVWSESEGGPGVEPLEDPVLSSYSRCLAGDILCVWRRVSAPSHPPLFDPLGLPQPAPPAHPPLSLAAAKELWIFWYGEEPDLSGIVSQELLATGEYRTLLYSYSLLSGPLRTLTYHHEPCSFRNGNLVPPALLYILSHWLQLLKKGVRVSRRTHNTVPDSPVICRLLI